MKTTTRPIALLLVPLLLAWAFSAAGSATAQSSTNGATAEIKDAQGRTVGSAMLTGDPAGGVRMQINVTGFEGAAAGEHGIHVHAVGVCEAPGFTTAGGHFNPAGKKHGLNSPEGAHGGDLPNLVVEADGSATYSAVNDRISLDGGANSIFDADGSAIVIHAGPDDMATDPAGNSGARVACGVLTAALVSPSGMPRTGEPEQSPLIWLALFAFVVAAGAGGLVLRSRSAE